jgi:hypothetical protein
MTSSVGADLCVRPIGWLNSYGDYCNVMTFYRLIKVVDFIYF